MNMRLCIWYSLIVLTIIGFGCKEQLNDEPQPVDLVYPFLDTSNSRWFFFSSASRPFGMVNLSPDMVIDGAWNSGYRYEEDSIKFFSHIHAWQLSGVPVMPTTGAFKGHLGPGHYQSKFSHQNEKVIPGYHQVFLDDYQINVELTSTTRVGFHRYSYPTDKKRNILLDLGTVLGPSDTKYGSVKKISNTEIEGYAIMDKTIRRPKPTNVYFVIQLNQPFVQMDYWQNGEVFENVDAFDGAGGGISLQLDRSTDEKVLMKVGISYTSEAQARKNIEMELPHWEFEKVVDESRDHWNEMLGRIEVKGNTNQQIRRFYTDLWKTLQGRRIISDADGQYTDMTGDQPVTRQIPLDKNGLPEFNHYNSDSFWGAQWTITTLWQLVYPEIASEFINSMLLMYQDGGWIPRGPSGGNYTHVMTGASSTPFIVGAYMKGIRDYDIQLAYEGLLKNHLPGGTMAKAGYEHQTAKGGGLEFYIENGFVPYPLDSVRWGFHQDGAGQTLEYAFQDWCLAQLARELNKEDDHETFIRRSTNWQHLFDSTTLSIRPKNRAGQWKTPFDPFEYRNGFVESNAAQMTWYVPHDLAQLANLMGSKDIASDLLNEYFETASQQNFTAGKSHDEEENERNRRIPINYGNQPSIQTAYVFNHLNKPWLTQHWSREVVEKVFMDLEPQFGYSGDEDQGLMSALAVLMKMGLFEMTSGAGQVPEVDLSSPIFDSITIHLNQDYYQGDKIEIITQSDAGANRFIQYATWNGEGLQKAAIEHRTLTKGGKLVFTNGDQPNTKWGVQ
ncbi:MAG: GH92 family glycosyl hydrolase [Cyclobacteriaceae bacterium]